jgi:hypothetical protein
MKWTRLTGDTARQVAAGSKPAPGARRQGDAGVVLKNK